MLRRLVLFVTLACAACQAPATLTPAPASTATPAVVVVTAVVAMVGVAPTATPDCLAATGVEMAVVRGSDNRYELQASGLKPAEIPFVFYSGHDGRGNLTRMEDWGFVQGADADGKFSHRTHSAPGLGRRAQHDLGCAPGPCARRGMCDGSRAMTVRAFLAGLIALVCVVVAACSAPGPRPGPPAAATQPPASVPSSTPAPANTTVPPTPADSLTLPHTTVPATATPLPSAILDAWRFLPACGEATTAIDLATLPAANQPGWKQYTQPDYGLSVAVPPDWRLAVGAHALCLAPTAAPSVILTIGFRGSIESAAIDRIAIGAGELITRGSVIILGQPATRNVLVYQGQDKAILYDGFGELYTPYLALTANLDDFGPDYDAVALPPSLQATADQIVASLASALAPRQLEDLHQPNLPRARAIPVRTGTRTTRAGAL